MKAIPPQVPVLASFIFLPELSDRENLYPFYYIYDGYFRELNGKNFALPALVHWALIDFRDRLLRQDLQEAGPETALRINRFLKRNHWQLVKRYKSILLLYRF